MLLNSKDDDETNDDFNESLFTIIDEMEEEDSKQSLKQANEFFSQNKFEQPVKPIQNKADIGGHLGDL